MTAEACADHPELAGDGYGEWVNVQTEKGVVTYRFTVLQGGLEVVAGAPCAREVVVGELKDKPLTGGISPCSKCGLQIGFRKV